MPSPGGNVGLLKEKNGNILLEGLMIQMSQPKSGIEQCTIKLRYAIPILASQRMIYYFLVLHLNSFFFILFFLYKCMFFYVHHGFFAGTKVRWWAGTVTESIRRGQIFSAWKENIMTFWGILSTARKNMAMWKKYPDKKKKNTDICFIFQNLLVSANPG